MKIENSFQLTAVVICCFCLSGCLIGVIGQKIRLKASRIELILWDNNFDQQRETNKYLMQLYKFAVITNKREPNEILMQLHYFCIMIPEIIANANLIDCLTPCFFKNKRGFAALAHSNFDSSNNALINFQASILFAQLRTSSVEKP